jgi:hypothetical protein
MKGEFMRNPMLDIEEAQPRDKQEVGQATSNFKRLLSNYAHSNVGEVRDNMSKAMAREWFEK